MKYVITKGLENNNVAMDIRTQVFVNEQGFKEEFDQIDKDAFHVVIFENDIAAATGRLFYSDGDSMKIGRVAVLKEFRGKSLGSAVISILEEKALELGGETISLSSQIQAKNFYEKLGYKAVGEEYFDEHCPHVKMIKTIG